MTQRSLPPQSPTHRAFAAALNVLPVDQVRLARDFTHFDRFLLQGEPERALLTIGENWTHLATHDIDRQVVEYDVTRGAGSAFPFFLASVGAVVHVVTRAEALAFVNTLPQWICFDDETRQVYVEDGARHALPHQLAAQISRAYARPEGREDWDQRSRLTGQLRVRSALQGLQRAAGRMQFPEPRMAFADTPIGVTVRRIFQGRSATPYGHDIGICAQILSLNGPEQAVVVITDKACIPLLHREDESLLVELDRGGPIEVHLVSAARSRKLRTGEICPAIRELPTYQAPDRTALERAVGAAWLDEINAQLARKTA
ncbi:hypothetical protein [Deinococcus ficus]|uniref:Uncharacterized protein n=1 Tax=Deinococcus ficus TaxID=317577 RepID=A0A221T2R6_9DEIO|nr:hypothetical protein [Deinococcus ficus]ASN83195.1 hypothetical protein DFI_18520 [Deinococcus ficus]